MRLCVTSASVNRHLQQHPHQQHHNHRPRIEQVHYSSTQGGTPPSPLCPRRRFGKVRVCCWARRKAAWLLLHVRWLARVGSNNLPQYRQVRFSSHQLQLVSSFTNTHLHFRLSHTYNAQHRTHTPNRLAHPHSLCYTGNPPPHLSVLGSSIPSSEARASIHSKWQRGQSRRMCIGK